MPDSQGAFPREDWVENDRTARNNAFVRPDGGSALTGSVANGVTTFHPTDDADKQALAMFYSINAMHDALWRLGFREADGNFQKDNYGDGIGSDRVLGTVFPAAIVGTATMVPSADGVPPQMAAGPYAPTMRHTALDATVIYHEYMHAVSHRLVGGTSSTSTLDNAQSASMGEGWSDYIACSLLGTTVVGAWSTIRCPTWTRSTS